MTTISNITYQILAEEILTGKASESNYTHNLLLKRPKGTKTFWALRNKNGNIEIV